MKNYATREHWVEPVDQNEGLFGVYFHGELDCFVRGYTEAKQYLQELVDAEDYENGNQKDYGEFEI